MNFSAEVTDRLVLTVATFQVYSNENSGNSSPLRTRGALDEDLQEIDDGIIVHKLDHAELGSKVYKSLSL